jgi:hypothetical protein
MATRTGLASCVFLLLNVLLSAQGTFTDDPLVPGVTCGRFTATTTTGKQSVYAVGPVTLLARFPDVARLTARAAKQ